MKIRNGFVSNSSSSSYIIRGVKIPKADVAKLIDTEEEDWVWGVDKAIHKFDLVCRAAHNYFEEEQEVRDNSDVIIGISILSLDDGEWTEMPNATEHDDKILVALRELGLTGTLSTYVRYVSNDNF